MFVFGRADRRPRAIRWYGAIFIGAPAPTLVCSHQPELRGSSNCDDFRTGAEVDKTTDDELTSTMSNRALIIPAVLAAIALAGGGWLYLRGGGAEGVGRAITTGVVTSFISIIVADYFITRFMM